MRRYVITPGEGIDGLKLVEAERPSPARGQVLVKMHAGSLNFRELLMVNGQYPGGSGEPVVPLSDGAGEVIEVGADCTRFKVGDRVAGAFMQGWTGGGVVDADIPTALGGAIDGVLTEYRVFEESGLVSIPDHLSYEEAATLPCAAVTAWNALYGLTTLKPGQTVLTLGTGGVSIFALQFAVAAGARVIATSSSDEKLARARELGAAETINYRTHEDWDQEVRRLTNGRGVDTVVEVGGPGTLARSIASTARDGSVQLIGVLSMAEIDPLPILTGGVMVRGFMVGSREMFEAMNRAIAVNGLRPVIDRSFAFEEAADAFRYLASAAHFGKVVIRIAS
ncbi:zinc-dependent alcohol dehydrogenase family protein [Sphingomonas sp. ID0503]|uniref:zinc-dependent alcohol dehydrogenase family protein n=1 Tax=Sphingomonas sp. ID0503 TaxID=3399691 RepID=UPI003AFA1166